MILVLGFLLTLLFAVLAGRYDFEGRYRGKRVLGRVVRARESGGELGLWFEVETEADLGGVASGGAVVRYSGKAAVELLIGGGLVLGVGVVAVVVE